MAGTREARSFCRICSGYCGMILEIDEAGRIVAARGDKAHPLTRGYACIKGLQAPEAHNGPSRLRHPLKRLPDGSFARIPLDQALDEIGAKLAALVDRHGPEALAAFRGTITVYSALSAQMLPDWLAAFGSRGFYSTMTIDQSAKWVTVERLGLWSAGKHQFADADVWMWIGTNPLLSLGSAGIASNPALSLRDAKARGLKLIVIDPRHSETAQHADLFIQPKPGEDVAIAAGLINIILAERWHDAGFCADNVAGLGALRRAVARFTPDYVAARAGIAAADLHRAAAMFADGPRRGVAHAGTGVTMAPRSTLADHLFECLNVICGRYLRAGEAIANPGVLSPARAYCAEVIGPSRGWEHGEKGRIGGHGMLFGEKMTAMLADEMLTPGPGQVRALFVDGGNPASAVPDQRKFVAALKGLDLLVTIDPFLSTTARLSHYVLPPTTFYEHADMASPVYETSFFARPFAAYTPAIVAPPADAEVADDWLLLWEIARRAGREVTFFGEKLGLDKPPGADQLHRILLRGAPATFDMVAAHAGQPLDLPPAIVAPASADAGRFAVAPPDVVAELVEVRAEWRPAEPQAGTGFPFRLISRRLREVSNSMYHELPAIRRRVPYNAAYLHSQDLAALDLAAGDRVRIISDHGEIPGIVSSDDGLRRGTVSMAHGWGGLPDDQSAYEDVGAYTGLLISTDRDLEPINAMPRQSAIPVRVEAERL
jgi:anaerobic selenocysteine-containing dehydrogenase